LARRRPRLTILSCREPLITCRSRNCISASAAAAAGGITARLPRCDALGGGLEIRYPACNQKYDSISPTEEDERAEIGSQGKTTRRAPIAAAGETKFEFPPERRRARGDQSVINHSLTQLSQSSRSA